MKTCERDLVVRLDEAEIAECGRELARLIAWQIELKNERDTLNASINEKQKRATTDCQSLARKISTKQDLRPVICEWRPDYEDGVTRLFRTDYDEEIDKRKLTEEEKQLVLPLATWTEDDFGFVEEVEKVEGDETVLTVTELAEDDDFPDPPKRSHKKKVVEA